MYQIENIPYFVINHYYKHTNMMVKYVQFSIQYQVTMLKEQKLVIGGSKGFLVFDDTLSLDQKLKIYKHIYSRKGSVIVIEKSEAEIVMLSSEEPLKEECRHFIDCIKTRQQPRTNINEGIAVVHMLQLAQERLLNE